MNNLDKIQSYIDKMRAKTSSDVRHLVCPFDVVVHVNDRGCSWCNFLFPGRELTVSDLTRRTCPCYSKFYGHEETVRVMREFFPTKDEQLDPRIIK